MSDITYRCPTCRKLLKSEGGHRGELCPLCGVGHLSTVTRVSEAMLADAERTLDSRKAWSS